MVTREIRDGIVLLATLIRGSNQEDKGTARAQAILTYCALVGAIGVARAVSDQQLSREILKAVALLLTAFEESMWPNSPLTNHRAAHGGFDPLDRG